MVYDTCNELVNGVYKPINITGGPTLSSYEPTDKWITSKDRNYIVFFFPGELLMIVGGLYHLMYRLIDDY